MATDLAPATKNDELQLCYDFKRDLTTILSELQRKINRIADIPKSQSKVKRDLRNALCGPCRGKSHEILNLPLLPFSNVGCQTVDPSSGLELSKSNEEFLNQMLHILIENERLRSTKSGNEDNEDQNRRTRELTAVQPLPTKGLDVNKGTYNNHEKQEIAENEVKKGSSEKIKKLTLEKEELENTLKSQQETIKNLQTSLEEQRSSQNEMETATSGEISKLTSENNELQTQISKLTSEKDELQTQISKLTPEKDELQTQISKLTSEKDELQTQISKLTSEKDEMQSNLETQQIAIGKLRTTLEMKVQETDGVKKARDTYHPQQRGLQQDLYQKTVDASSDGDIAQEQSGDATTHSIGKPKHDKVASTIEGNVKSEQIKHSEMEFEKITRDIGSSHETIQTLQSENDRLVQETKKLQDEITEIKNDLKENTERLTKANDELDETRAKNTRLKEDFKRWKQEEQNLRRAVDDLNKKIKQTESELKQVQTENKMLKNTEGEKMTHLVSELRETSSKNKVLEDNLKARDDELKSLNTEKSKLDSQMKRLTQEKQNLQNKLDALHAQKTQTDSELKNTQRENENLTDGQRTRDDEMKRLKQEKHSLQNKRDDLHAKKTQAESELKKTRTENKNVTDSQKARDDELESLKTEKSKLDSHVDRLTQEKQNLQHQLDGLCEEKTQTELELKKTQRENKILIEGQNEQREEKEKLHDQIKELSVPKRKRVVIGLRGERSGLDKRLVDIVTTEMTRRLQQRLDEYCLNLTISFSQVLSDVTNGLQVVLCKNVFETGTNISEPLKGCQGDRNMFVMVIHLTTRERISSLTPTSRRMIGNEARHCGGILDMACSQDSGLYDCGLNNTAIDKMASVIRTLVIL